MGASQQGHRGASQQGHRGASQQGHRGASQKGHRGASQQGHRGASQQGHRDASQQGNQVGASRALESFTLTSVIETQYFHQRPKLVRLIQKLKFTLILMPLNLYSRQIL